MNKLYKLLKEYDNILLDKKFIEKAFDYYLEEDSDLKDYVCNIKVTDNDEDSKITFKKEDTTDIPTPDPPNPPPDDSEEGLSIIGTLAIIIILISLGFFMS